MSSSGARLCLAEGFQSLEWPLLLSGLLANKLPGNEPIVTYLFYGVPGLAVEGWLSKEGGTSGVDHDA